MAKLTRSWWGNRFIETLETFTDAGRLSRGRSYSTDARIKSFEIKDGTAIAKVRGSVNPYFGVYKEPTYTTKIELKQITPTQWTKAIAYIASKAGFLSKLMLNEMPEEIEDAFKAIGLNLLPQRSDLKTTCSCPDYSNPCKHIAGVYYRLARELDGDPFLLFEWRGLDRDNLRVELLKTPLGQALVSEMEGSEPTAKSAEFYYSRPGLNAIATDATLRDFWQGQPLQPVPPPAKQPISGIVVKKQGDMPPFWHRENSFIAAMDEVYHRVRRRVQDLS